MYRMSTIILLTAAPVLEKRLHSVVVGSVGFGLVGVLWCVFCGHVVGVSVCECMRVGLCTSWCVCSQQTVRLCEVHVSVMSFMI